MMSLETPIHTETQNAVFRIPLIIIVAGILLFGAWQIRAQQWQSAMLAGMAIIAAGVIWGLTQFSVEISSSEIRFGFPLWRKKYRVGDLEVGAVEAIPFGAGIGIHFWRRKWVYNARFGRGVIVKTGKTTYLLGSNYPERLQNALLGVAKHRESA
jgi:hypothetical protein